MLDDLAEYLQVRDCGVVAGDIFIGMLPDSPDCAVALIETVSSPPIREIGRKELLLDNPRVAVWVRGSNYGEAKDKIYKIYLELAKVVNMEIGGVNYLAIDPVQSPFLLERDAAQRPILAFNADIVKEPS